MRVLPHPPFIPFESWFPKATQDQRATVRRRVASLTTSKWSRTDPLRVDCVQIRFKRNMAVEPPKPTRLQSDKDKEKNLPPVKVYTQYFEDWPGAVLGAPVVGEPVVASGG